MIRDKIRIFGMGVVVCSAFLTLTSCSSNLQSERQVDSDSARFETASTSQNDVYLHYSFDGPLGPIPTEEIFPDESGNGNFGTLIVEGGQVDRVAAPAAFGQSWADFNENEFNRVQIRVPLGVDQQVEETTWSVAFWYDVFGTDSEPLFFGNNDDYKFLIDLGPTRDVQLRLDQQAPVRWSVAGIVDTDSFAHYAIVADENGILGVDVDGVPGLDRVALYIDGALISPVSGQDLTGYGTRVIMDNFGDGDIRPNIPGNQTGTGVVDELWVFTCALRANQIGQLISDNTYTPGGPPPTTEIGAVHNAYISQLIDNKSTIVPPGTTDLAAIPLIAAAAGDLLVDDGLAVSQANSIVALIDGFITGLPGYFLGDESLVDVQLIYPVTVNGLFAQGQISGVLWQPLIALTHATSIAGVDSQLDAIEAMALTADELTAISGFRDVFDSSVLFNQGLPEETTVKIALVDAVGFLVGYFGVSATPTATGLGELKLDSGVAAAAVFSCMATLD